MDRAEIISALIPYFKPSNLVCRHTYNEHGFESWRFLTTEILHTLLVIRRDILGVPLICNDYPNGSYQQRGLRCNLCEIVKTKSAKRTVYLSAHVRGNAFDLQSPKMEANEMRQKIKENSDKLPYPVRIEKNVTWLHIDCDVPYGSTKKVVEF